MSTASASSLVCARCSAPLGVNDRRCPFCGAEHVPPLSVRPPPQDAARASTLPSPGSIPPGAILRGAENRVSVPPSSQGASPSVRAPAFQGGEVGTLAYNETPREREQRRAIGAVRPRRSIDLMEIVGGLAVLGLVAGGVWYAYDINRPLPAPPPPPSKPKGVPAVVSSIGDVAVNDADRADPTEMLAQIQRKLVPGDAGASLVSVSVVGSRAGVVDLKTPGASVTYLYATGTPAPGATAVKGEPLSGREGRQLVLKVGGGQPETVPLPKGAAPVPEPLCVWSAAWRSAVKGGLPEGEPASGVYALKNGEPRWVVSIEGKPELTRDIDGKTCAIKTR